MIGIIHILAGAAGLLVVILKAIGITSIGGHTVTVGFLTTMPAYTLLASISQALGVNLTTYGAITGQKAVKVLTLFASYGTLDISKAVITKQSVAPALSLSLRKALIEAGL